MKLLGLIICWFLVLALSAGWFLFIIYGYDVTKQ